MVGSKYLTDENVLHLATVAGQAHFACDANHTCRECLEWSNMRGERNHLGNLKAARCRKALLLSANRDGIPPIPHGAIACRHFALNTAAPTI